MNRSSLSSLRLEHCDQVDYRLCHVGGGLAVTALIAVPSAMIKISYSGYRFPPEIIQQAIWLYIRFTLSFRDVEDLLAERGIMVSYETVRRARTAARPHRSHHAHGADL